MAENTGFSNSAGVGTAAFAAMDAVSSVFSGISANKIAKINAAVYQQQAAFIDVQKKMESERIDIQKNLEAARFKRFRGAINATFTARLASSGLDFGGSAVAVMIDNMTQIGIDESIMKYNFEIGKATNEFNLDRTKLGMMSTAREYLTKGRLARDTGYSNAFSTALNGATKAYPYFAKEE